MTTATPTSPSIANATCALRQAREAFFDAISADVPLPTETPVAVLGSGAGFAFSKAFRAIGKTVAGGIVGGTASFGLSRAFEAIFGSPTSDRLEAIEGEVRVIAGQLVAIEDRIAALAEQLKIGLLRLEAILQEAAIGPAIARIEVAYSDLVRFRDAAADPSRPNPTLEDQSNLMEQRNGVRTAAVEVSNALVGTTGLRNGLLVAWTDFLLASLPDDASTADRVAAFGLLEALFQQLLHLEYMATAFETSALCADTPFALPCPEAVAYVEATHDTLRVQFDVYDVMAQRLVIRDVDVTANVRVPDLSEAQQIFVRADLLRLLALDEPEGIRGRVLLLPSRTPNATGPALQPAPGYAEAHGRVSRAWDGDRAIWPRGLDLTDDSTMTLRSPVDSFVRFVRYTWDWPAEPPAAGEPLPGSEAFTAGADLIDVRPQHFDANTFEPTAEPGPPGETILMANFLDASAGFPDLSRADFQLQTSGSGVTRSFERNPLRVTLSTASTESIDARQAGLLEFALPADTIDTFAGFRLVVVAEMVGTMVADYFRRRLPGGSIDNPRRAGVGVRIIEKPLNPFSVPFSGNVQSADALKIENIEKRDTRSFADQRAAVVLIVRPIGPKSTSLSLDVYARFDQKHRGLLFGNRFSARREVRVGLELERLRLAWVPA